MALTYEQEQEIANTAAFRNRVGFAMLEKAGDVMAENQSGMTGVDYNGQSEAQARTSLAVQTINDPIRTADFRRWFIMALAGGSLTWTTGTADEFAASIPDSGYLNFISANWSTIAGWREAAF